MIDYTKGVPDAIMSVRNVEVYDDIEGGKLKVLCKCTSCGTKLKDVTFPECESAYTKIMDGDGIGDGSNGSVNGGDSSDGIGGGVSTASTTNTNPNHTPEHNPTSTQPSTQPPIQPQLQPQPMTLEQVTDSIIDSSFTLSGTLQFELNRNNKIVKIVMSCDSVH